MLGDAAPPRETPLILVGRDGRRRVVLAADGAARRGGLRVCMPASKAQALVKDLIIRDAEPAADAAALDRLALWALRYAPIAAADPPDGLVIDVAGATHLHGGEGAMLADMVTRLASAGIAARVAIAGAWGAAHALARFAARPTLAMPESESAAAIAALPIVALRLPVDVVDSLRRLGFDQIADLEVTPRGLRNDSGAIFRDYVGARAVAPDDERIAPLAGVGRCRLASRLSVCRPRARSRPCT